MVLSAIPGVPPRSPHRYVRAPVPLHFPSDEKVPESKLHRLLVTRLWASVERELGERALIACDQFLYWDPTDPTKRLAPDVAVQLGGKPDVLKSWKTWQRGAPHVGVEIVSESDEPERLLPLKLERYRQAGIPELVRFDPAATGRSLRLWDLLDGDLVERDMTDAEATRCDALGLFWCTPHDALLGPTLRLARDRDGRELVLSHEEAERSARKAAEARIAELEAQLASR